MNGPVAQFVSLVCHGNSYLRGDRSRRIYPGNSTFQFCDRVAFVSIGRSWFGKPKETMVAPDPDAWFAHLAARGARGVRLLRRSQDLAWISDRMTAGLAGGGGDWMMAVRYAGKTEYWTSRWDVWDQDAPLQKIWRVRYFLASTHRSEPEPRRRLEGALPALKLALEQIHAFAKRKDCRGFMDCFQRATLTLERAMPLYGYHRDLCPEDMATPAALAVLDAAQSAWVFGGMGSWNDLAFEGEDSKDYERVSAELFSTLNDAICAAANETDASQ